MDIKRIALEFVWLIVSPFPRLTQLLFYVVKGISIEYSHLLEMHSSYNSEYKAWLSANKEFLISAKDQLLISYFSYIPSSLDAIFVVVSVQTVFKFFHGDGLAITSDVLLDNLLSPYFGNKEPLDHESILFIPSERDAESKEHVFCNKDVKFIGCLQIIVTVSLIFMGVCAAEIFSD
jgi:hypothetical protein